MRQRARPTQQRAAQTRRLLLDTTLVLLDRDGYERLTTAAITERAHVSTGTFYRYFSSKSEILTVLRDEAVATISGDLMVSVVGALDADLDRAMRSIVETLVDGFERHRAVILALVDQTPAGHHANVLPEIERDLHQLASLLPRRHRPDLPPERLEAVVFLTMGVLVSTCLRIALQRPPEVDRAEVLDLAVAMLAAGLGRGSPSLADARAAQVVR